jgi:nicotinamide-nucleotide amidase
VFPADILDQSRALLEHLRSKGLTVATAESCSGGLVAGALTAIAGSSDVVDRGFVTYTNTAKTDMLGVPADVLERVGAVSPEVAAAMVEGVLSHTSVDVAVSVTGIAGPGGAQPGKPVGLVYFGASRRGAAPIVRKCLFGDIGRDAVRLASVREALGLLAEAADAQT